MCVCVCMCKGGREGGRESQNSSLLIEFFLFLRDEELYAGSSDDVRQSKIQHSGGADVSVWYRGC